MHLNLNRLYLLYFTYRFYMYFYVVGGGCAGVLLAETLGEDAEIKMLQCAVFYLWVLYVFLCSGRR